MIGNLPVARRQSQPVLNGVRVDLDAIAAAIKGEGGGESVVIIDDCAAIVDSRLQVLVLFVSGAQAAAAALPSVVASAKRILPYWSQPSYVVDTGAIPRKGHSIDREKLQTIFTSLGNKRQQYAVVGSQQGGGEWTPLEARIRRILSKVAGLPQDEIQRTQTIFHLGLDSISAIQLSSDLRKDGIFLNVAEILKEATVERMAAAVRPIKEGVPPELSTNTGMVLRKAIDHLDIPNCLSGISPDSIEAVFPATAGQLYMLDCWKTSNCTLFMPTFTFKSSRIEHAELQHAWESLVRHEPILRTAFYETGHDYEIPYVQVVLKSPPQPPSAQLGWLETSQPADDDDGELLRFINAQERRKNVDIHRPPVRLRVLTTPTHTFLFLTIHHALYDGVSLPLLLSRLSELVRQRPHHPTAGRPPTLNPECPKFEDYLALIHSQQAEHQRAFWTSYLAGAASTAAPVLSPIARVSFFCPAVLPAQDLEAACRGYGISLQAVFLAAFANVLARRNNDNDVVFGIYLSNRNLPIPGLLAMAAPTLNIVPLRVRLATPTPTPLVELAQQVQSDLAALGTPQNATADLRSIQRWTGIKVDCYFNFLKTAPEVAAEAVGVKRVFLEEVEVGVDVRDDGDGKRVTQTTTGSTTKDTEAAARWRGFLRVFLKRYFSSVFAGLWRVLGVIFWFLNHPNRGSGAKTRKKDKKKRVEEEEEDMPIESVVSCRHTDHIGKD